MIARIACPLNIGHSTCETVHQCSPYRSWPRLPARVSRSDDRDSGIHGASHVMIRSSRLIGSALLALCAACCWSSSVRRCRAQPRSSRSARCAGRFDYYLMSLSWSPSYCQTHPDETDQCGSKGFGFVLHGLWPQNRNGDWTQHCGSSDDARRSDDRAHAGLHAEPASLIEHEWQTHGTCSGLDPKRYFESRRPRFRQREGSAGADDTEVAAGAERSRDRARLRRGQSAASTIACSASSATTAPN